MTGQNNRLPYVREYAQRYWQGRVAVRQGRIRLFSKDTDVPEASPATAESEGSRKSDKICSQMHLTGRNLDKCSSQMTKTGFYLPFRLPCKLIQQVRRNENHLLQLRAVLYR